MDHKKLNDLQLKIAEFEMILSELGTYIYTKDLNGRYTYMNQQLLNIFKANYEDVIGKQDKDFFDLQISDQMQRNDQRVILENISLQINESSFIKALGETKVFNSLKKPTYNSDGKLVGMLAICKDITENKPAVSTEKAQKHLLNAVLNHLDAYIYIKDHRRIFKYVNRNVARLLGKPIDQIVGEKDIDVLGKEIADDYWQSEKLVLETKKKHTFEESHRGKDGLLRHYFSVKIPYQIDKKTPAVIGFSTDITELYQLKEELKKQANTDPLTELNNRRFFMETAEREYHRTLRHHLSISVMSIDIDHFKAINDTYGHPVGDQVLIQIGNNILSNIRTEDILARIGGEEFSVLLPETDTQQALLLAERIRESQQKTRISGNWQVDIQVTVSIGVATLKVSDKNFDELFLRADNALYTAKNSGRNQVSCAK